VAGQVRPAGADGVEEAAQDPGEGGHVAGADVLGRLAVAGQVEDQHPAPLGQFVGVEQPVVEVAPEAVEEHQRVAGRLVGGPLQVAEAAAADLDRPGRRLGLAALLLGHEAGLEGGHEGVHVGVGDRGVGQHPDQPPDRDDGADLGHPAAQHPGRRRLHRPVDLLRLDLEQLGALGHLLAHLDQPVGDLALAHGKAPLGHAELGHARRRLPAGRHTPAPTLPVVLRTASAIRAALGT
jgi:hypothetical protein